MHFSLLNNYYTITPHVFVKTAAPERSSVGFHWAGGGGACGGSSLQEYNKIQLLLLLLAATQLYSFVLSIGVHSTSCQVLTSAASTVKKMLLDMTLLQSKFFTFLAFKGGKKINLRTFSWCHNWIKARITRQEQKPKATQFSGLLC